MPSDDVRILRKAREMLTPPGSWQQGGLGCPGQPMCIIGAIDWQCRSHAESRRIAYLVKEANGIEGGLFTWNDRPDRTHAEVLVALDRAIAHAEARQ